MGAIKAVRHICNSFISISSSNQLSPLAQNKLSHAIGRWYRPYEGIADTFVQLPHFPTSGPIATAPDDADGAWKAIAKEGATCLNIGGNL
jgi:hypothetical protein